MLKKLLSVSLTLSMILTATATLFTTTAGAAGLPIVFEKTTNTSAQIVKANEDFQVHAAEADYTKVYKATGVKAPFSSITKTNGSITVKQESNGNKYALFSGSAGSWDQRFNISSISTSNSVLVSYDYRNATGDVRLDVSGTYGTGDDKVSNGNAIVSLVSSKGTVIKNQKSDTTLAQIGGGITLKSGEWTNFKAFIVPSNGTVHFYINDEYWGYGNYRKDLDYISSLWIGIGSKTSVEIDNVSVINMGTTDGTYYNLQKIKEFTFDAGTDVPFTVQNTVGNGVITSDGTFKMTSVSNKNGETKHYVLNLNNKEYLTDYAKISFDWCINDDTTAGTTPVMHMYLNGTKGTATGQIATTVSFNPGRVSAINVNNATTQANVKTNIGNGWHTMDVLLDLKEHQIYYVIDGTVSSPFPFRVNVDKVTTVFFRIYATSESDDAQIDNLRIYIDKTKYLAPKLSSSAVSIDTEGQTIVMTEDVANTLTDMDNISQLITSDVACSYTVNDVDGDGGFSDGDTVIVTTDTGMPYVYTIDVRTNVEPSIEALIVKGADGQGDDFCRVDTITKAGNAEIELRIKNNFQTAITPLIMAASYDDNGKIVSASLAEQTTIAAGATADVELTAKLQSNISAGKLQIVAWTDAASLKPIMKPITYSVDTNDFKVPTVISDNMVLQRNSTAYIFGKAPEGATVTAALDDGTTATYTVPEGSNEFFAGLEVGDYNNVAQKLTISAVDKNGVNMGAVTRTGVLIGDVYYGGGQSNMTRNYAGTATEIKQGMSDVYAPEDYDRYVAEYKALPAKLANVRYFSTVAGDNKNARDSYTDAQLATKEIWKTITVDNIGSMSEVMVNMAAEIATADPDVPVGIIVSAQGGTKLAKWVSRDTLLSSAFDQAEKNEYERNLTNTSDPNRWASHTDLYYTGVRPLMPYGIKAAVWYQGESDSSSNYDKYLKAMIDEFRAGMRNEEIAYFIVQLPGYVSGTWTEGTNPSGDGVAKKRLLQWNAQEQLSNVYTVVTNDTGDNGNIHPANKVEVGNRLARYARAILLGEDIPYTGPTMSSVTYGNGTASVKLNLYGGTLKKYDPTEGANLFHLHDGNGWKLADSITVSDDTVTVGCSAITGEVRGVRYAYGNEITKCIYAEFPDGAKLPLVPFDTMFVYNVLN